MPPIVNPIPAIFIIATAFGVMMHDTKVDHAASMAITAPAHVSLTRAVAKGDDHTHVERVSGEKGGSSNGENIPKTQPRNEEGKYSQSKKSDFNGGGRGGDL